MYISDDYGGKISFDNAGDAPGRYNITNYKRNSNNGRFEYVQVGKWSAGMLTMNEEESVTWAGGTNTTPRSQCSRPCLQGHIKQMQGDMCCWICTQCRQYEYVLDEFTCADCGEGNWPFGDKRSCYELPALYMEWTSLFAIIPIVLAGIGIIITILVGATFARFIDTPVVKASGRELSFMLLAGFVVCFLMTLVLLAKPTPVVCSIQRAGVGFGFAVTYAALLTKTNRISRIFDSASTSAKRPAFISPKSQVVIATMLILVQVGTTVVWLVLEPPGTRRYSPEGKRDKVRTLNAIKL